MTKPSRPMYHSCYKQITEEEGFNMKNGFDIDMAKVIEVLSNTVKALAAAKELTKTNILDKSINEANTALGLAKSLLEDLGDTL